MQEICMIKTSVASQQDARKLARDIITARLAACIQITGPGESIYRWQGAVEQTEEWYLNIKTSQQKRPAAIAWLMQQHPYEVPEIICLNAGATDPYANWLNDTLT